MIVYCNEGFLILFYTILAFCINFFIYKIIKKNLVKIFIFSKYKKISKLYSNSFDNSYFVDFFQKNKNFSFVRISDLIVFNNKEEIDRNFYMRLIKFQFLNELYLLE